MRRVNFYLALTWILVYTGSLESVYPLAKISTCGCEGQMLQLGFLQIWRRGACAVFDICASSWDFCRTKGSDVKHSVGSSCHRIQLCWGCLGNRNFMGHRLGQDAQEKELGYKNFKTWIYWFKFHQTELPRTTLLSWIILGYGRGWGGAGGHSD